MNKNFTGKIEYMKRLGHYIDTFFIVKNNQIISIEKLPKNLSERKFKKKIVPQNLFYLDIYFSLKLLKNVTS